jgi:hypothetical protein
MDFFNKKFVSQNVLTLLFVIYLILGLNTPKPIAQIIDTLIGKIVIILIAIYLFIYTNPILGVIGFFVAYDLIRRSSVATGNFGIDNYLPTEETKQAKMSSYNQYPYTLEQEMVKKMVPVVTKDMTTASYVPMTDDVYDAAPAISN